MSPRRLQRGRRYVGVGDVDKGLVGHRRYARTRQYHAVHVGGDEERYVEAVEAVDDFARAVYPGAVKDYYGPDAERAAQVGNLGLGMHGQTGEGARARPRGVDAGHGLETGIAARCPDFLHFFELRVADAHQQGRDGVEAPADTPRTQSGDDEPHHRHGHEERQQQHEHQLVGRGALGDRVIDKHDEVDAYHGDERHGECVDELVKARAVHGVRAVVGARYGIEHYDGRRHDKLLYDQGAAQQEGRQRHMAVHRLRRQGVVSQNVETEPARGHHQEVGRHRN